MVLAVVCVAVIAAWAGGGSAAVGAYGAGKTTLVSVSSSEAQGDRFSQGPRMSSDGRYVAFASEASNLVRVNTVGQGNVFVRDRRTGTTRLVSVNSGETPANDYSDLDAVSANGRYVAFHTLASNLVRGDTNGVVDGFLRDMATGTTSRVSLNTHGAQGNDFSVVSAISADGRYVVLLSYASNLVPGDTNEIADLFVRDRASGTTRRISVSSTEAQANGFPGTSTISKDGRYVAFSSDATNLVRGDTNNQSDVFVRDRDGDTRLVSVSTTGARANDYSYLGAGSANGRYVGFGSLATNLVPGDTNGLGDAFVRDLVSGTTRRVSVSSNEAQALAIDGNESGSVVSGMSADGRYVTMDSDVSNLVPGDTNGVGDVFVRDRVSGTTRRASVSAQRGRR